MPATIEMHPDDAIASHSISNEPQVRSLRWRRDGDSMFYEGRLIERTDGSLAFITSYADRPDRTDLIQIEFDAEPSAKDHHRLLVRCVEGHDDMHCLVACSDA